MITVPGRSGKTVSASIEDVRAALDKSQFISSIKESIDKLNFNLATELCHFKNISKISENIDSHISETDDGDMPKTQQTNDETLGDLSLIHI